VHAARQHSVLPLLLLLLSDQRTWSSTLSGLNGLNQSSE
jgi:hypothetical protein